MTPDQIGHLVENGLIVVAGLVTTLAGHRVILVPPPDQPRTERYHQAMDSLKVLGPLILLFGTYQLIASWP